MLSRGKDFISILTKKFVNLYNIESIRRLGIGNQLLIFTFLGAER